VVWITTGRQLFGWFIPQAALYSPTLLMMGKIVARNLSSSFEFINKLLLLHLIGFLLYHRSETDVIISFRYFSVEPLTVTILWFPLVFISILLHICFEYSEWICSLIRFTLELRALTVPLIPSFPIFCASQNFWSRWCPWLVSGCCAVNVIIYNAYSTAGLHHSRLH